MYKKLLIIVLYLISSPYVFSESKSFRKWAPKFVILITSYNNEKWAEENLVSACYQKSTHPYKIIFINDCSTDRTGKIVDDFVDRNDLEPFVTVIHNDRNLGQLENIYKAVHERISDNRIVVSLDGDDLLMNDEVLLTLEKYYKDPDIWMTYGSAQLYPSGKRYKYNKKIPDQAFHERKLRHSPYTCQHLRSFRAALFKKIQKNDLMKNGSFFKVTGDLAFMLPMQEMCCPRTRSDKIHSMFIPEMLYHYRMDNPISVCKTNKVKQLSVRKLIRKRKPYMPLRKL